jgi:hypothetical protein
MRTGPRHENDALPGAQDVEHRFRQRSWARLLVAQPHKDRVAAGCAFRLQPLLAPLQTDQQTSLGAGVLDRGANERIDQPFARYITTFAQTGRSEIPALRLAILDDL